MAIAVRVADRFPGKLPGSFRFMLDGSFQPTRRQILGEVATEFSTEFSKEFSTEFSTVYPTAAADRRSGVGLPDYRMGVVTRDNSRPARSALRFSQSGSACLWVTGGRG